MKQLVHFMQSMSSGKFRKFDYKRMNMKYYNTTTPPEYNIQSIKAPIYLYHANEDALASKTVRFLRNNSIPLSQFLHLKAGHFKIKKQVVKCKRAENHQQLESH